MIEVITVFLTWLEKIRLKSILRKYKGINIVVLGWRYVGKSTYLEQLEKQSCLIERRYSPTTGINPIKFTAELENGRLIKIKTEDVGGDESQWTNWRDVIRKNKPKIIIFLVDHENFEMHIKTLQFLRSELKMYGKRCKFMLFLINKSAYGHPNNYEEIYKKFAKELSIYEKSLNITVYHSYCSAKYNINVVEPLAKVLKKAVWYY